VDDPPALLALDRGERPLFARSDDVHHLGILHPADSLLPAPPVLVDRLIAGHRHEPGRERPVSGAVAIERLVDLHEDLLGQVFGLVDPSREPVGQGEDAAGVAPHELAPGRLVPSAAPGQEVAVVVGQDVRCRLQAANPCHQSGTRPAGREFEKSRPDQGLAAQVAGFDARSRIVVECEEPIKSLKQKSL
jgi:hypothetical protein